MSKDLWFDPDLDRLKLVRMVEGGNWSGRLVGGNSSGRWKLVGGRKLVHWVDTRPGRWKLVQGDGNSHRCIVLIDQKGNRRPQAKRQPT
jgi:hypothetical protein